MTTGLKLFVVTSGVNMEHGLSEEHVLELLYQKILSLVKTSMTMKNGIRYIVVTCVDVNTGGTSIICTVFLVKKVSG